MNQIQGYKLQTNVLQKALALCLLAVSLILGFLSTAPHKVYADVSCPDGTHQVVDPVSCACGNETFSCACSNAYCENVPIPGGNGLTQQQCHADTMNCGCGDDSYNCACGDGTTSCATDQQSEGGGGGGGGGSGCPEGNSYNPDTGECAPNWTSCPDGSSAPTLNDCPESGGGCPEGTTPCPDDSCSAICPTSTECGDNTSVYPPDTCPPDPTGCPAGEQRCSSDNQCAPTCPTTCSDNSVVSDPSECPAPQCNGDTPCDDSGRCPVDGSCDTGCTGGQVMCNGSCADSCDTTCQNGQIMCDGSCTDGCDGGSCPTNGECSQCSGSQVLCDGVCSDSCDQYCPDGVTIDDGNGSCDSTTNYCPDGITIDDGNGSCDSTTNYCPDGITIDDGNGSCDDTCSDPCDESCANYDLSDPICDEGVDCDLHPEDPSCPTAPPVDCEADPTDPSCATQDDVIIGPPPDAGSICGEGTQPFVQTGYSTDCLVGNEAQYAGTQTTQFVCVNSPEYNSIQTPNTYVTVSGHAVYPYGDPFNFYANASAGTSGTSINNPFSIGPLRIPNLPNTTAAISLSVHGSYNIYCKKSNSQDCTVFVSNPSSENYNFVRECSVNTSGYIPYIISDEDPLFPPIDEVPPIVDPSADSCPNIDGIQDTVPDGYTVDADGNCVSNVCDPQDPDCNPPIPVDGICGSADGSSILASSLSSGGYATDGCSVGTESAASVSGSTYSWSCLGSNGGVDGSCSATQILCDPTTSFYCDVTQSCLPNGEACNDPLPPGINPNIGGHDGHVQLSKLRVYPPVINSDNTCHVKWDKDSAVFYKYTDVSAVNPTKCTLTDQNGILTLTTHDDHTATTTFWPGSTNSPLGFDLPSVKKDTLFTLKCWDGNDVAHAETATGICRINSKQGEFN